MSGERTHSKSIRFDLNLKILSYKKMKLKFKIFIRVNRQVIDWRGPHHLFALKGSLDIEKMDSNGYDFVLDLNSSSKSPFIIYIHVPQNLDIFINFGFRSICYNSNKNY